MTTTIWMAAMNEMLVFIFFNIFIFKSFKICA